MPDNIPQILKAMAARPENFPRARGYVQSKAIWLRDMWNQSAGFAASVPIKQGGLGWWGRNYLARGQIKVEESSPLKFQIKYEKSTTSGIDFENIVENGRPAYDIVKGLLAKSKKVRISANGIRYLIVPLPNSGEYEKPIAFFMSITGTSKDSAGVTRNSYKYSENRTKGNTAGFYQAHEKGGGSTTSANLVMITDKTNWKPYPAIKGRKFTRKIQDMAKMVLAKDSFNKDLAQAVYFDILDYLKRKHNIDLEKLRKS